jgi:hypothetical protein
VLVAGSWCLGEGAKGAEGRGSGHGEEHLGVVEEGQVGWRAIKFV